MCRSATAGLLHTSYLIRQHLLIRDGDMHCVTRSQRQPVIIAVDSAGQLSGQLAGWKLRSYID